MYHRMEPHRNVQRQLRPAAPDGDANMDPDVHAGAADADADADPNADPNASALSLRR